MSDLVQAPQKESWVSNFVARARGNIEQAPPATPASYLRETGSTVADYGVAGLIGAAVGGSHAKWGIGTKAAGVIAGLGAAASIGLSGHFPVAAQYARKAGSQAFGLLSCLKVYEAVAHHPLPGGTVGGVTTIPAPGGATSGVHGEDPIEAAAKGVT